MKVVVDAAPLVAAADRRDTAHRLAISIFADIDLDLLVPDPVIAEVDHLLRDRVSAAVARAFLEDVREGAYLRVVLDPVLFGRAVDYDRRHADLDLGIADASVMAVAEAERAPILTFDFADFRATRPMRGGFWRLVIDEDAFRGLLG